MTALESDAATADGAARTGVPPTSVIVMGVSGSGKTTIGEQLAAELGLAFIDGDALHPAANVEKMATGTPLDDEDRMPWLGRIGDELAQAPAPGLVIACSALKQSYRRRILESAPATLFLHLDGSEEVLTARMNGRDGHFMPAALLASQLSTLEPLAADEPGMTLDITEPVATIVTDGAAAVQAETAAVHAGDAAADSF